MQSQSVRRFSKRNTLDKTYYLVYYNRMIGYSTVTQKGQVTIPAQMRHSLGLKRGQRVIITRNADGATIKSVPDFFSLRGSIKTHKKFDIKAMRKSAMKYVVGQYIKKYGKTP